MTVHELHNPGVPQDNGPAGGGKPGMWELAKAGLRDSMFYRLYMLGILLLFCTLFYYFGEIVDYFQWEPLRWNIFYAVHDVHRLFFLLPILFAAYAFGVRATIIIALVTGGIWMPRAFFFSPYPFPELRAFAFLVAEGILGFLTATTLRQKRRIERLETVVEAERDRLRAILRRMTDGVIVIGPDYRLRFVNAPMRRVLGESVEAPCYRYIYHQSQPCGDNCRLKRVLQGTDESWRYVLADGTTYEVSATPYVDADGAVCQLATYRDVSRITNGEATVLPGRAPASP